MASINPPVCDFGWQAPHFDLTATDGKRHNLSLWSVVLWCKQGGADANRCLPVVLRVHVLQNVAQANARRLLRVLQLRHGKMSADPGTGQLLRGMSSYP